MTTTGGSAPTEIRDKVEPLPVDDENSDDEVFHDARFPAEEEAVSWPILSASPLKLINVIRTPGSPETST